MNRRSFLKRASAAAGGIVTTATIGTLTAHSAWAGDCKPDGRSKGRPGKGYGPLKRTPDQHGVETLALPEGFDYVTFGKTGQRMSDGFLTPRNHDGMTCLPVSKNVVRLIRNHELRNAAGDFNAGVVGPASTRYDPKGMGGCVSLDFDICRKELVRDFISINGTIVNCSGGLAYHDAGWLTCEETVSGPAQGFDKPHGYTFLVSRDAEHPAPAQPIKAMGRFAKEAAVADNASGIVFQTEDAGNDSGFYRFLPNDPAYLIAGGTLQMLKVRGISNYDTRTSQTVGAALPVEWVTIDNPEPDPVTSTTSCFAQGFAKGGARFNRLEGMFRGDDGGMYFVSTSGGNARRGQLWRYIPSITGGGTLALVFESPGSSVLDSPDNFCITPSGGVIFCEDDASGDNDVHTLAPDFTNVDRLIGLGQEGEPFEFAVNIYNQSEFAGACFSPDGDILFVNIFGGSEPDSGLTCAIWGPWRRGAL
jgi:secreted PhoX family phosphatase